MVDVSRPAGRAGAHADWYTAAVLLILLLGFAVRLGLAATAPHPGIADPNHYYNLAQSLRQGRGFVIDYIWQYHHPPAGVTHPIDHWMPLAAVWPALAQSIFGGSVLAALLPSALAGGLLPLLSAHIAGRLGAGRAGRLFALAATACLPELILNSVRTDTTIFYTWFVGLALLALHAGVFPAPPRGKWGRGAFLFLGGALAGLAHLTRQDGMLLAAVFACYLFIYRRAIPWRQIWLLPAGYLVVFGPWLLRNAAVLGEAMPSGVTRSLFLTTLIDQYSYAGTFSLQTYLEWGWGNIVGKRLFEALASLKLMYALPGGVLSIAAVIGLQDALRTTERRRLLALPLLALAALFGFYTLFVPFLSQGGSFKKSYMAVLPFVIALGAAAVEHYVTEKRLRGVVMTMTCGMLLLDGLVLVKNDFAQTAAHLNSMQQVAETMRAAGDANDDGEIIIMTQDPFMLNYLGFRALMLPNDSLDITLAVAARYRVDYILMPPARAALEPVYLGEQTDPRLAPAAEVPGTNMVLYRVNTE